MQTEGTQPLDVVARGARPLRVLTLGTIQVAVKEMLERVLLPEPPEMVAREEIIIGPAMGEGGPNARLALLSRTVNVTARQNQQVQDMLDWYMAGVNYGHRKGLDEAVFEAEDSHSELLDLLRRKRDR